MAIGINENISIQGAQEPLYEEIMELVIVNHEMMNYDHITVDFTDHEGDKIQREFEFWDVWEEGEEGEYSMFKSLCGEYALYVETSMGEATPHSRLIEIEYIG